jgi:hypothetical protein
MAAKRLNAVTFLKVYPKIFSMEKKSQRNITELPKTFDSK